MIWVPSDTEAWEPAYVIQSDSTSVQVKTLSNKELRLPKIANNYDSVTLSSLEEDCENLVNLESFCEGIILHHVRKRFRINKIYTSVGSILVAINPYKTVDIYGPKVVDLIYEKTKKNEVTPPHVFSIGAAAVHRMRLDAKDQSVLISGTIFISICVDRFSSC